MSMVAIIIFKDFDASLFIKWNHGLILQLFKYSVSSVNARIIYMSVLLFISVVRMVLQSYTYMTYMYLSPLLDVVGKHPHRSE